MGSPGTKPPPARPEVPFGGFKQSGLGTELGVEGPDRSCETKSVQVYEHGEGKR